MSAIYNHSVQGGAIHALPFMIFGCNNKVQIIAFATGMIFGAIPDILKWRNIEPEHEGKINDIGKFIPAWYAHTKVIDVIYHKIFEPYGYILNWLEVYLTALSVFILITFIKGII
jgi:hypothetical protein